MRAGSSAGSREWLGEVIDGASAYTDASCIEVIAVSSSTDGTGSHANSRCVISVACGTRVGADWSIIKSERSVGASECAKSSEVVSSVSGIFASGFALSALRITVKNSRSAWSNVERLTDGHAKLAIPVSVVENRSFWALKNEHA